MKDIYLLFIALFLTFLSHAQMVLEYEIPVAGDSIALPLNGTVDVTVDWGDGQQEDFTSRGNRSHVYETAGTKTVTITGSLTTYGSNQNQEGNKYLTKVISWNLPDLTSLSFAFYGAKNLTEVPSSLPLAVTNLGWMFNGASSFNQSLNEWDTERITSMKQMFNTASSFNGEIGNWNTSNVTDMSSMFRAATSFNQSISNWNTSSVTDMAWMFVSAWKFDQNIGNWNTENVTNLSFMFYQARAFNKPIGTWDVSNVKSVLALFLEAYSFNQPLENWRFDSLTSLNAMFADARSFNQPLNSWDTKNIKNFEAVFQNAIAFNQPLDNWNTSSVESVERMFKGATSFNQSLDSWNINLITNAEEMFYGTALSTCNYDSTLNGWASQTVQEGVTFDAGDSKYSAASEAARAKLTEKWTITDGGLGITEGNKCTTHVGLDAYLATRNVEIYPNPVSDKLYIKTTSLSSYAVYSLTGNLLEEAEGSKTQIDLSDLPSGIYILQTTSELGIRNQQFSKE